MIINSIVIDNIRSYVGRNDIDFSPGTSLFKGDIGSGKSTVLMAIEFALFGSSPQKPESLLRKNEDTGYVILDFSENKKRYEIKRALKKTRNGINQDPKNTWLRTEGTKELLSPSELKQRILEILQFNESAAINAGSRIFRYAIFTPQEAMKAVLTDPPMRLETIRKAFQMEKYSTAIDNSRTLLSEINIQMKIAKEKFSNISELESQIKSSKDDIETTKDIISKKQVVITDLDDSIVAVKATIEELYEKNKTRIRLISDINNLKHMIGEKNNFVLQMNKNLEKHNNILDQLKNRLDELESKKKLPNTSMSVDEIESKIQKFQRIYNDLQQQKAKKRFTVDKISSLDAELADTHSDMNDASSDLQSLQKQSDECNEFEPKFEDQMTDLRQKQTHIRVKLDQLKTEINTFSQLGSKCPTCKQSIDEEHARTILEYKKTEMHMLDNNIVPITTDIEHLKSKMNQNKEQQSLLETKLSNVQNVIKTINERDNLQNTLRSIDAGIRMFTIQYSEFGSDDPLGALSKLKDDLVQYNNISDNIWRDKQTMQNTNETIEQTHNNIQNTTLKISEYQSSIGLYTSQLESFENVDGTINVAKNNLNQLQTQLSSARSDLAVAKSNLLHNEDALKKNIEQLSISQTWKSKYNVLSQSYEWLDKFFIDSVKTIERQVLLSILEKFNEQYNDLYSKLIDDRTKTSRIDESFTPVVEQDGYEYKIDYLSGGERTSIALAYRLTLNILVRDSDSLKSSLLILDEPTDGFSPNQLTKVREILQETNSEQIILVSHERNLESCADHVFEVLKIEGVSSITRRM